MTSSESCVISLLFVFLAIYIPHQGYEVDLSRILHGLLTEEGFPMRKDENRVAIGFGSCVDITTNGVELMKRMGMEPPETPVHNSIVSSEQELSETFAFFLEHGSASE